MKLMKRMAFLAVIVVGGIVLLRSSYGSLAMKRIHGIYNERVSPETKLDLIKEELAKIGKDMRKNIGAVAEETVAVDNLREDVEVCQKNLDTQFERIVNMKKDVDAGEKVVMKNGRTVSVVQLQEKMSRAWESYKTSEDTLKSKHLLAAHEKALDAGRERLGAMKEKREQLEVQVAQLEAELKNVRLAQTRSDFNFDDSRIGDIQRSLGEVRNWVKAERVKVELEGKYTDTPAAEEKKVATADVMKEIEARIKDTEKNSGVALDKHND